jgi:hypothetical protein
VAEFDEGPLSQRAFRFPLRNGQPEEISSQFVRAEAEMRGTRFSPAADVIAFDGLIHLTTD